MRRYSLTLLAAAATIGLGASIASAADLPMKAAPRYAPPPVFSWSGFYIGAHGGAGWGTVESQLTDLSITDNSVNDGFGTHTIFSNQNIPWSSHNVNGWLFGGTVGWNWQANPWLVLGIEGDWTGTDIKGTSPCGVLNIFECNARIKWTADITGRLGFAVDRALLYVKGGVVWAKSDYSTNLLGTDILAASTSDTRIGALFGAGVEYAFLPNWSAKIEYNFMDFGKEGESFNFPIGGQVAVGTFSQVNPCSNGCTLTADAQIKQQIHLIKAGVNYRFDWGRAGGY